MKGPCTFGCDRTTDTCDEEPHSLVPSTTRCEAQSLNDDAVAGEACRPPGMVFSAPAEEGAVVPGHAPLCPPGTNPAPAVVWAASLAREDPRAGACLLALAAGANVVKLKMSITSWHSYNCHPSFPKQLDARTVPLPSAGAAKTRWIDRVEVLCTTETCAMVYCVHSGDHVKQEAADRQPTGKLHPWGLLPRQWRRSTGLLCTAGSRTG